MSARPYMWDATAPTSTIERGTYGLLKADVELDDEETVHICEKASNPVPICGAVPDGLHVCSPDGLVKRNAGEHVCRGCGKPYCVFCLGLLRIRSAR